MKLGCHAVLFKEKIKTETDVILNNISSTGFEGFEMGARFFGTEERDELQAKLDKYGLELTGMHVGGLFEDWISNEEEMQAKVLAVAEFVKDMPNKNVILSGRKKTEDIDLKRIAKNIEKVAKKCLEMGVKVNYHNHVMEFENNAEVFKTLIQYAPSLYFGLDLGWVYVGGFNPIKIVKEYEKRISYVHLRDVKEGSNEFVELGQGIIDFSALFDVLKDVLGEEGWAIVEYENWDPDIEKYIKARKFLDTITV